METIYAVIKNEVWDGENWDEYYDSFHSLEDAKAQLKKVRDETYPDWQNELIEEDRDSGFYAYRDGEYNNYHISLYVLKMKLWNEGELK